MKILHITFGLAPNATGGLPAYVRDLSNEEKNMENEVFILKPGAFNVNGKVKIVKTREKNVFDIINPLPVASIFGIGNPLNYMKKCDSNIYKQFLLNIEPDIIHVHSIMGIHKEFFEVAKQLKIKMIYTTHDYFGLCLRSNFINREGRICKEYNCEQCSKCNYKTGLSKKKAIIMQSKIYNHIKKYSFIKKIRTILRKKTTNNSKGINIDDIIINEQINYDYQQLISYYKSILLLMDYFHYNSEIAKEVYEKTLGNINGKIIPITLSSIQDNRKEEILKKENSEKLTIGYIGRAEEYKGINLLINALRILDEKNVNYECNLYGDDFISYESEKVHNKGMYKREDLGNIMNNTDIIVVPSVWKETFGFVTLEALSYNVPVIVTNCVGSKILIKTCELNPIVEPIPNSLAKKIQEFAEDRNKIDIYKKWIEKLDDIFSMNMHVKSILKMYEERIKS